MIKLKCPDCGQVIGKNNRCPGCGFRVKVYDKNIYSFLRDTGRSDVVLSRKKWNEIYKKKDLTELNALLEEYRGQYFRSTYDQINSEKKLKGSVYLEIGCGEFQFGNLVSGDCRLIIGVDFSLNALYTAKKLLVHRKVKNYLLIHADINQLPVYDDQVDIIFGGGVIEHFESTGTVVGELYRVLKKNGISFNTVPYFNLGSLTYRQVWGNIPNVPVLKQVFGFIHMKLLRGKLMKFGYELSFTRRKLLKIHEKAGFRKVTADKFDVKLRFDFLPKFLKGPAEWLAQNSPLFWPMIKVVGRK